MSKSASQNPYVGPRSLRFGEKIYGRDRETRQLLDLLIAERIVLLYSPSGAGKTSLIQAGLIPELEKEEFHVLPVIRVNRDAGGGVRPRNPYVMSALVSLEQGVPAEQAIAPEELATMTFAEYLNRRETASGRDEGTFLIFDQFEEILTLDPTHREQKMDFFNQVGEALRDLNRWALFAMREEYVAALDPFLRPIPTRLKSTFRLDLLGVESARVAVQRPAKECGVAFTEEATTKLVDDLREVVVQEPTGEAKKELGPYIEPVQLQVVCYRLWEKLDAGVTEITAAHIVGTGTVDSALADYYAERIGQIAGTSKLPERVLREWFDRRLITEGGIRSQVMVGSENSREVNETAIQKLVDVHLIRGEERRGVTWLELAHDRMVKPIRADNAAWRERNLSVLQHQAAVWNNKGRSDALCLRGEARKDAQKWADEHADELTQTERDFLAVCKRNHDARTYKWGFWAAAVMFLLLLCFGGLTVYARKQAKQAKNERNVATEQRDKATRERNIANARSIAARAFQMRDERLDISLLLATQGQLITEENKLGQLPDTLGSLLTSAYHNPRLTTYLHGSPSSIGAVAFNHDKTRVATGDFTGLVLVWDVKTHRIVERLPGLVSDAVRTIAFSGDGRFMAVSSKDKTIVLREIVSGEMKRLPPEFAHRGDVWSVAFTGDSKLLASADSKGQINLWDLAKNKIQTLPSLNVEIRAVAFDPGGTRLFAGCRDGRIVILSRVGETWREERWTFSAQHPKDAGKDQPVSAVRCLSISADGKYLAAGRSSGAVDLYNLAEPGVVFNVAAFGAHDGGVSGLAFSPGTTGIGPDETRLITSSFDGTLRLWKVPSMEAVGPAFTGHVGRVLSVAFSADKQTVISGGADRRAILWDTWYHVAQMGRAEASESSFSIAFSADGTREANGFAGGSVVLKTRDLTKWPAASEQKLTLAEAMTRAEAQVRAEGLAGDAARKRVEEAAKWVPIVTFSGDNRRLAATTPDGGVRIHDLEKVGADGLPTVVGKFALKAEDAARKISTISLSRHGAKLAAAVIAAPARVFVWEVATGELLFADPLTNPKDDELYTLEFTPDGNRLVTGGDGERTVIWSVVKNQPPQMLEFPEDHTGKIRSVAFSPDGKMFATTSGDNTLIIWDTETRARLSPPLAGHHAPVVVAAFSPDGKLLASGSDDHSVILWEVESKQPAGRLTAHTDSVRALAFSADSRRLYTGSWDGELRKWELHPDALKIVCRERANRNLTATEWASYVGDGPLRKTWPGLPDVKIEPAK